MTVYKLKSVTLFMEFMVFPEKIVHSILNLISLLVTFESKSEVFVLPGRKRPICKLPGKNRISTLHSRISKCSY